MPSRRRSAATKIERSASLTSASPMVMRPVVFCSSPAIIRSVVVLPQPEGPSSVRNSPASTFRLTRSTASAAPKARLTLSSRTAVIGPLSGSLIELFGAIQHLVLAVDIGRPEQLDALQLRARLSRLVENTVDDRYQPGLDIGGLHLLAEVVV